MQALLARVERLESLDQIRQLPAKYALALDMRNFDALVNLFVDDYVVSKTKSGRAALKKWYDRVMRGQIIGSAHGINGHIIDFENPDMASGLVYSRNDLETATRWMAEFMAYLDRYERRDGVWYFQRRTPLYWYQSDITDPPLGGGEAKIRWDGQEWTAGSFHAAFPTWAEFWADADSGTQPVKPPAPLYRFLQGMRDSRTDPEVTIVTNRA
jgi:hypothetical protein